MNKKESQQLTDTFIPGYPVGSNITLLNTIYRYPVKIEDEDNEESYWEKDYIDIIYRDNNTGQKKHCVIEQPDYEFYIANDDIYIDHHLFFIDRDDVRKISVPYCRLEKRIAELTNNMDYYNGCIETGNRKATKELHTLPNIFLSDTNIEDHYRFRFSNLFKNETFPLHKAYFDIEVDSINMKGDFPEPGECPINALSYIDDGTNTIYVFLLENENNPLIEEFKSSINANLFEELKNFIIDTVGGIKKAKKFNVADLNIEFYFYDEEIKLLHDFFIILNKNEPDFLLAWNMAFDIPYIIERLWKLGYNPVDIMCHPDFEKRVAEYYIDEIHRNEYEARGDQYIISSYTTFLDQLVHFASRRKGQSAFPNFKLDTAGSIIAGVRKLDYSHITTNISELPYKNYKIFVFYNIIDTIVQKCIEEKVNDIDYIFGKCTINNTRYSKGHRQTVYLANRGIKEFFNYGYVMGNNNNRHTEKTKFPGALVGDPLHNSDYSKLKQNGEVLNVVDNADDFDFKSLYPSITCEGNMAPNTQIGKIIIENPVHRLENPFNFEFYERGGQFLEDLTSGNTLEFCNRWLHFADYKEWLEDLYEYFHTVKLPLRNMNIQIYEDGLISPIEYYPNIKDGLISPIHYDNMNVDGLLNPIYYTYDKFDYQMKKRLEEDM